MGTLKLVWADLPDEDDERRFKQYFKNFFGVSWEKAVVGAEKTFDYHRYWDAYLAVAELERSQGLTVNDLPVSAAGTTKQAQCNIIIG